MTTKFNQGMYAQIRPKKNKPLSNLGTKNVKVTDKGASVTSAFGYSWHWDSEDGFPHYFCWRNPFSMEEAAG